MGDVYELLNFFTGDDLFTHVLPRACRFARPLIIAQHPQLAGPESMALRDELTAILAARIESPETAIKKWLKRYAEQFGESLEIASDSDTWLSLDPLAEAEGMFPGKVVAVSTDALISELNKQ